MGIASRYRHLIAWANSLEYFPTPAQAKKIDEVTVDRYGKMIEDGLVRKGRIDDKAFAECQNGALREVMDRTPRVDMTISGKANDAMARRAAAVIQNATGKKLRVRIEEM